MNEQNSRRAKLRQIGDKIKGEEKIHDGINRKPFVWKKNGKLYPDTNFNPDEEIPANDLGGRMGISFVDPKKENKNWFCRIC